MKEGLKQRNTDDKTCLLECIAPGQADDKLKALYEGTKGMMGFVPNAAQLLAVSPMVLAQQLQHIGNFSGHPTLGRALLAYVRYAIADKVQCTYCIDMNVGFLVQAGVPLEAVREAGRDPGKMPLTGAEKAMARFVLKMVDDHHAASSEDISELRRHGWTERDILDATYHAAQAMAIDMVLEAFHVENDIPPVL